MSKEKFIPANGRILIQQHQGTAAIGTSGKLVLPEDQIQKPGRAKIISIDPINVVDFKEGEEIVMSKMSGWDVEFNGEKYKMIHQLDIWGTVVIEND